MKKIIITTLVIIIVAIAGSVYYVMNNLDSLVEAAIEKYGSQATQTAVLVDSVKISLQDGAAAINGITIANPQGFQSPLVFSLGEVGGQVNIASLAEDIFVIDDVRVRAPRVFAEVNEKNKTNLLVLKDNILKMIPSSDVKQDATTKDTPAASEPRIIIKRILFEEGFIDARIAVMDNKLIKLKLPSFELKEMGGTRGATPAELSQQILKKLTDIAMAEVKEKVINQQLDKLKAEAKAKVEAKKAELRAEVDEKKDQIKAESEQKIDAKKEQAKEKLKGLFSR